MREATIKVYKFSELEGAAREKARDTMIGWLTDHDWWESCFYDLRERLSEVGVHVGDKIYFDADRARYAYCPDGDIQDWRMFVRAAMKAGVRITKAEFREIITEDGLYLDNTATRHPEMRVIVGWQDHTNLTKYLRGFFQNFLDCVDKEYDYLCSDESVNEFSDANEYEWDAHGRPFRD